jgi:hypothetical protein
MKKKKNETLEVEWVETAIHAETKKPFGGQNVKDKTKVKAKK